MIYLFLPLIVVFYMIGGQCHKWIRREGVPTLCAILAIISNKNMKMRDKLYCLKIYLLAFVLSMGYGIDSKLYNLLGRNEIATRSMYGVLVSAPFLLFKINIFVSLLLVICYNVKAGRLGSITIKGKEYDILIEDIVRGTGIAVATLLTF